jgi:hypothetical protein
MSRLIRGFSDTGDTDENKTQYMVYKGEVCYHIENKNNFRDVFKNGIPLTQIVFISQTTLECQDTNVENKKDIGDKSKYFEKHFDFENCENNLENKKRKNKKQYSKKKKKKTNFFSKKKFISHQTDKYTISDEYEDIYYTVGESNYEEIDNYADYKDSDVDSDFDLDFERFHYRNGPVWSW